MTVEAGNFSRLEIEISRDERVFFLEKSRVFFRNPPISWKVTAFRCLFAVICPKELVRILISDHRELCSNSNQAHVERLVNREP